LTVIAEGLRIQKQRALRIAVLQSRPLPLGPQTDGLQHKSASTVMDARARHCLGLTPALLDSTGEVHPRLDSTMRRMLSINGLVKRYGARTVLDGLTLELAPGELVAVVGESGAGKSTLLNLIAGLEMPDAGRIELGGSDLAKLDDDARTRLRRQSIGFVFQAFHIIPHLTALENTVLPLVLQGVAARERVERANGMLEAVGLGGRADSMPRELSGGELQRIAIARALVHRPTLVLADEPTGNLDPDTAQSVLGLLAASACAGNAATIVVTHSENAAKTADRVLRLTHGQLRISRARTATPP